MDFHPVENIGGTWGWVILNFSDEQNNACPLTPFPLVLLETKQFFEIRYPEMREYAI